MTKGKWQNLIKTTHMSTVLVVGVCCVVQGIHFVLLYMSNPKGGCPAWTPASCPYMPVKCGGRFACNSWKQKVKRKHELERKAMALLVAIYAVVAGFRISLSKKITTPAEVPQSPAAATTSPSTSTPSPPATQCSPPAHPLECTAMVLSHPGVSFVLRHLSHHLGGGTTCPPRIRMFFPRWRGGGGSLGDCPKVGWGAWA